MSGSNNGTPIGVVSAVSSEGGTFDTHDLANIPELEIQEMDKNCLIPLCLANSVCFVAWADKEKRLRTLLLAKRREKVTARHRRVEQERCETERHENERDEAKAAAVAAEQKRLDDEAAAAAAEEQFDG
jgi:hypothetical protein